jgi:pimeloyl-ACP methyl ester carboxylesterase
VVGVGPSYDPTVLRPATLTLRSGLRVSYAEHGSQSGPAVLMVPGPTDSWRSYAPVLALLPHRIRAIALSPRGHGDSDRPDDGYAVEDFAADAVDVLDALEIDRAVLAGHSGSCLAARRVALDHPQRVAGLVLEASPTTLVGNAALHDFVQSIVPSLTDPIEPDFVRSFVTDTSSPNVDPELVEVLVAEVGKVPARVWRAMFTRLVVYDDTAALTDVRAPTRLIWGDGDAVVSRAMQDVLVARIPSAELIVYSGVGHTPRWEDPQRFAADLTAFVDRVD